MSSVKTRGGTPLSQHPAPSRFYIKAAQCSNSIFLLSDQRPAKFAATTTTRGQKSFHLILGWWLYILANRQKAGQEGREGCLSPPCRPRPGKGFKQKIIDIIDLARLAGLVWCGVVWCGGGTLGEEECVVLLLLGPAALYSCTHTIDLFVDHSPSLTTLNFPS